MKTLLKIARIVLFLIVIPMLAVALVHISAPAALAAPAAQSLPSDWLGLVLTLTVGGTLSWLATVAVPGVVAFLLGYFPDLPSIWRNGIAVVVIAAVVAGIVALSNLLPQTFLDARLVDVVVGFVFSLLAGGGWKIGAARAASNRLAFARATGANLTTIKLVGVS